MPGKRFDKAPGKLQTAVKTIMQRYHSRLLEPTIAKSVSVETIVVYGPRNKDGEQTGPAITVHGKDAYACIRITKLEERVAGRRDAVMWIDGDQWNGWPYESLLAIIDHELTHIQIAEDPKTGEIQLDDAGRVKLRMRPHDFEVGWFDEIAERHAKASIEVMQATALANSRQMYFPGFDILPSKRRA
jgi:hypothetical protein